MANLKNTENILILQVFFKKMDMYHPPTGTYPFYYLIRYIFQKQIHFTLGL